MQPRLPNEQADAITIAPVDPSIYVREGSSKEPQYLTTISPVSSKVYISSYDAEQVSRGSFVVHPVQNLGTNFRRVRMVSADFIWTLTNVNPRNNVLTIIWPANGVDPLMSKTYGIAVDEYNSIATLNTAINNAIAGDPFEALAASNSLTYFPEITLTSTRTFYIDPNCGFYKYGASMYGITADVLTPKAQHIIGPVSFLYTQWVDILSSELTKNQKMRTVASNNTSNILARVALGDPSPGARLRYIPETYLACARNINEPLYQFDITFLDQYGLSPDAPSFPFTWFLTLELEL